MSVFRYTLLSDGSSDRALMPHLTWLLQENGITSAVYASWADLGQLREKPRNLIAKIELTIDLYPSDLLFIHRDAERENLESRKDEVNGALAKVNEKFGTPLAICVIPVRMQEAWLLFDAQAIRRASGNPNGQVQISLPSLKNAENLPNPKEFLFNLLKTASERSGRRLAQFNVRNSANQVSQYIDDFSPLRILPAFQTLESDLKTMIAEQNWSNSE